MSTHTPGPWESVPSTVKGTGTANRDIVSLGAVFSPCHVAAEANPENARLIAAAPDLLSCLVDMVNFYRREMVGFVAVDQVERAARAIRKAGGTTL